MPNNRLFDVNIEEGISTPPEQVARVLTLRDFEPAVQVARERYWHATPIVESDPIQYIVPYDIAVTVPPEHTVEEYSITNGKRKRTAITKGRVCE